ncbi:MAG: hypothetical protein H6737_06180 [Alphaproteobacteria bacterium]|nr:hypothetical protein [Alphaproteobacteria bacterium]
MSTAAGIAEFWSWWTVNAHRMAATFDSGAPTDWIDELSARVSAIHPDLEWEFGKGRTARHHLALASGGDPVVRVLAERWRSRGPGDDEVFEFYTARQGLGGGVLRMNGMEVDVREMTFAVELDAPRQRFDVGVWHPVFAAAPADVADRFLWVGLDNLLGEDNVTTWLGRIERLEQAPEDGVPAEQLLAWVNGALERWPEETLTGLRSQDESGEVRLFTANLSAKFLRHCAFDTLYLVCLPFTDRGDGFPVEEEMDRIYALSEAMTGVEGALSLLSITGGGERLQYIYLQGETGPARRSLDALVAGYDGARVTVSYDPGWRQMPRL